MTIKENTAVSEIATGMGEIKRIKKSFVRMKDEKEGFYPYHHNF